MAACRILLLLLVSVQVCAQANRYIVYFKDKAGSPYSVSNPAQYLSNRALERRSRQGIPVTEEDIPVNDNYIGDVQSAGAKTFFSSRWLNCVLIEATPATISVVQQLSSVANVELVAPGKRLSSGRVRKFKKRKDYNQAPATQVQLEMLGIDAMQKEGYRGEGKLVAVFDSGFEGVDQSLPFQHLYQSSQVIYTRDFVANTASVYQYDDHGTEVLSVMAAFSPGAYTGGIYEAQYMLLVTEDVSSEYRVEEFNWLFAAEKADSAGADVINASLGYNLFDDPAMDYAAGDLDGKSAVVTQAANKATAKGMLVVCSAGNEGGNSWKYVTPPADGKGILAVGSVNAQGDKSSFSSVGPTTDGRVKPDVVALGSGTSVVKPTGAISATSGTSVASPLVASLATGLWQAFPILSAVELYTAITASADQATSPTVQKGFGLPHFLAVRNFIELSALADEISIFPNPSTDSIRIAFRNPPENPATVSVYDQQGRLLQENSLPVTWVNQPLVYDLSELAAGIYFVKVKVNDQFKTIRLAKL